MSNTLKLMLEKSVFVQGGNNQFQDFAITNLDNSSVALSWSNTNGNNPNTLYTSVVNFTTSQSVTFSPYSNSGLSLNYPFLATYSGKYLISFIGESNWLLGYNYATSVLAETFQGTTKLQGPTTMSSASFGIQQNLEGVQISSNQFYLTFSTANYGFDANNIYGQIITVSSTSNTISTSSGLISFLVSSGVTVNNPVVAYLGANTVAEAWIENRSSDGLSNIMVQTYTTSGSLSNRVMVNPQSYTCFYSGLAIGYTSGIIEIAFTATCGGKQAVYGQYLSNTLVKKGGMFQISASADIAPSSPQIIITQDSRFLSTYQAGSGSCAINGQLYNPVNLINSTVSKIISNSNCVVNSYEITALGANKIAICYQNTEVQPLIYCNEYKYTQIGTESVSFSHGSRSNSNEQTSSATQSNEQTESKTGTISNSKTNEQTATVSLSNEQTATKTYSHTISKSKTVTESNSQSMTPSTSKTTSNSPSTSPSETASASTSKTTSNSPSTSPSETASASTSKTTSNSPSTSPSETASASTSKTISNSPSTSPSETASASTSKTTSNSLSTSASQSASVSNTASTSNSQSVSSTQTKSASHTDSNSNTISQSQTTTVSLSSSPSPSNTFTIQCERSVAEVKMYIQNIRIISVDISSLNTYTQITQAICQNNANKEAKCVLDLTLSHPNTDTTTAFHDFILKNEFTIDGSKIFIDNDCTGKEVIAQLYTQQGYIYTHQQDYERQKELVYNWNTTTIPRSYCASSWNKTDISEKVEVKAGPKQCTKALLTATFVGGIKLNYEADVKIIGHDKFGNQLVGDALTSRVKCLINHGIDFSLIHGETEAIFKVSGTILHDALKDVAVAMSGCSNPSDVNAGDL